MARTRNSSSDPVPPARVSRLAGGPRLPRVYVPRPRLWEQLDRATESAVTLLVAPVGAGKTLGVGGWLHHTDVPHATDATWIHADSTWTPARLATVLDSAAEA
ncbi:MAG TPA: hypothetical protein PL137_19095, partial [Nocardioides sp.]|nr:hypothetical protein [Nocardioides sp.]